MPCARAHPPALPRTPGPRGREGAGCGKVPRALAAVTSALVSDPGDDGATSRRGWIRVGVVTAVAVVSFAAPSLPRGVTNWDNVVKVQLARSLLRGEGLVLRDLTPDDAAYVQLGKDGRRYSGYMPLAAVLHVLTIQIALLTGVEAEGVPALFLLGLVAWALVSWGRRAGVSLHAAVGGAVLACLGTSLWPMAALGYDVIVEALAFALLLRAGSGGEDDRRAWLLAGAAAGAAFATRLGAALLAVPAVVLAASAPPRGVRTVFRRGAALVAGGAPGLLLVLWYNFHRFGSPFTTMRTSALGSLEDLAAPWLSATHLQGMAGLLLSPGKGILWYAPPMLLVLAASGALVRRHRAAALAFAAYAAAEVLALGRFRYWHGDWGWGPRYLAPLLVSAAPLAWLADERLATARARVKVAALCALVAAVVLQAAPVVGKPIPYHFALVLAPLEAEHRLVTHPVTRPPGPEDYGIHYFTARNSMIVSLARGLARASVKEGFRWRLLRALLVPLAAGALVAGVWIVCERRARGRGPGEDERGAFAGGGRAR